jgi:hypothetical protein
MKVVYIANLLVDDFPYLNTSSLISLWKIRSLEPPIPTAPDYDVKDSVLSFPESRVQNPESRIHQHPIYSFCLNIRL